MVQGVGQSSKGQAQVNYTSKGVPWCLQDQEPDYIKSYVMPNTGFWISSPLLKKLDCIDSTITSQRLYFIYLNYAITRLY